MTVPILEVIKDTRTQAQKEGWYPEEYGPVAAPIMGDEYVAVDTDADAVQLLEAEVAQLRANLA